jgi:hypothetical protein
MDAHLEIVYSDPETGMRMSAIFIDVDSLQRLILLRDWVEGMSDHITAILARCKYRMPRPRSVFQFYGALAGTMRGNELRTTSAMLPHFRCESTFTTARAMLLLTCKDLVSLIEYDSHPNEKLRQILPTFTQFLEQSK